jgi:hypothetical protein
MPGTGKSSASSRAGRSSSRATRPWASATRQVRGAPDLDPRLRGPDGTPRRLDLSEEQVGSLVAFLEALTDSSFLQAEKLSDPFPCGRRGRTPRM